MNVFRSIALVIALLWGPVSNGEQKDPNATSAIDSLVACSEQLDAAAAERADEARLVELIGGPTGKGSVALATAGECLDSRLAPALREARGSSDLTQALKDYFIAAQTLRAALDDVSGGRAGFVSRVRRAGEPHTEALQRVRMELMLNPPQPESDPVADSPSA